MCDHSKRKPQLSSFSFRIFIERPQCWLFGGLFGVGSLQAAATLCAGDVHQRHLLVQSLHHGPRLGHQIQPGLQPLLVLQRSHRKGVPHPQPQAHRHRSRRELLESDGRQWTFFDFVPSLLPQIVGACFEAGFFDAARLCSFSACQHFTKFSQGDAQFVLRVSNQ